MGDPNRAARSKLYRKAHGEPAHVFDVEDGVSIEAFRFNFKPNCKPGDEDAGYVMFTNGMSDRRMHLDADAKQAVEDGEVKPRAELIWQVREPAPYLHTLRWLAEFAWIDKTWLGWGHTIPMPEPIVPGTAMTTFLFLTPIIGRHKELAAKLRINGDPVELLVVHLLTTAEYQLKKQDGVNAILDLFDVKKYPLVLDPARPSMV